MLHAGVGLKQGGHLPRQVNASSPGSAAGEGNVGQLALPACWADRSLQEAESLQIPAGKQKSVYIFEKNHYWGPGMTPIDRQKLFLVGARGPLPWVSVDITGLSRPPFSVLEGDPPYTPWE